MEYTQEPENSAELLKAQYEKEAGLGRGIVRNASYRKERNLAEFIDPGKFPSDAIAELKPVKEGEAITPERIKAAESASLTISFDAALQILDFKAISSQVREDPKSLEHLRGSLKEGFDKFNQVGKAGKLEDLREVAVAAFTRRSKDTQGLEKLDPAKLSAWFGKVFRDAYSKIAQKEQAVASYGSVRPPAHQ
ncbi:MAG: hypothetical protein WC858_02085 [Parcubacteria group bacterium]|jgi:hypothetical protein